MTWSAYLLSAVVLLGLAVFHSWYRRPRPRAAAKAEFISLLIVVRNQEDGIEAFLRPLLAGRVGYGPLVLDYELVVVDAGSSDDTWAILTRLAYGRPGVRLLRWQGGEDADPFQAGLLVCRSPVTVSVDLTAGRDLTAVRQTLARLIHGVRASGLAGSGWTAGPRSPAAARPDGDPAGP